MDERYEKIIELVKELDVITISDVVKFLKVHYQTAGRILLKMEVVGILKHRVIMESGIKKYKVWVLRKY